MSKPKRKSLMEDYRREMSNRATEILTEAIASGPVSELVRALVKVLDGTGGLYEFVEVAENSGAARAWVKTYSH